MDSTTPSWPSTVPVPLIGRTARFFPRAEAVLMESGRYRKRRLHEESVELVEVSWNFTRDEYESFKDFFQESLLNGSLSFAMTTLEWTAESYGVVPIETVREYAFWEGNYSFARSDNLFAVTATLEVLPPDAEPEPLPPNACFVEFSDAVLDGGGDKFDCYADFQVRGDAECSGVPVTNLYPTWDQGNNLLGAWVHGENDFNNPRGDTFECYAPESDVQSTDLKAGVVFNGSWVYAGSGGYGLDTFENYSDGVYATDTMIFGVGFTGNWISE